MKSRRRRRKRQSQYSKGDTNKLIDSLLHPLFDGNPELVLVDTVLHGFVEHNSQETAIKFIRFNLPTVIAKIMKNR